MQVLNNSGGVARIHYLRFNSGYDEDFELHAGQLRPDPKATASVDHEEDSPSRLNSTLVLALIGSCSAPEWAWQAKAVKTVSKLQRPAKEPQWRGVRLQLADLFCSYVEQDLAPFPEV